MADYRVYLSNLLTGAVLEELPVTALSWSRILNAPGTFSATVALNQPADNLLALKALIPGDLGKIGLIIERDGTILFGGIPWTWQADLAGGTGTLAGEGWHSYVRRRVLREDLTYSQQDQTSEIAAGLIAETQTTDRSPVISTSDVVASGVLRDRTYLASDHSLIGQLIEDLAGTIGGFDFRYDTVRSGDDIQARFLTTPNTGRRTKLVFAVGKSITAETINVDATSLATHVDEIGSGTGDAAPRVTVANATLLGVYPILDVVESQSDASTVTVLDTYARQRLARGQAPVVMPSLTVQAGAEPVVGSYVEGDIVRVSGGYGLAQVDSLARIVQIDGDLVTDTMKLTFAGADVFQPA